MDVLANRAVDYVKLDVLMRKHQQHRAHTLIPAEALPLMNEVREECLATI